MGSAQALQDSGDAEIVARFLVLQELSRTGLREGPMHRFLDVDCLVGTFGQAAHLSIRGGQIVAVDRGPVLMKSWRFAYRATPDAWREHWTAVPRTGFHDLLAMTKRGVATVEGDLHPFLAHLQFFKDLLALPRASQAAGGEA